MDKNFVLVLVAVTIVISKLLFLLFAIHYVLWIEVTGFFEKK
jgi:hypothetical protein